MSFKHYSPWFAFLGLFYALWGFVVLSQNLWPLVTEHWPMALSMAIGSYAAGSTPMGGGTVGFPVLVLLFDMPASLGRDFSFAVQSIGMVSASIFILCRRQALAWSMLRGAMIGALVGTPLGILFLSPLIPELWIKLAFAVIWGSFGLLHLYRLREITSHSGLGRSASARDFRLGLAAGFCAGGMAAAITGVGIDMVIYALLVLLCRVDLKVAIPTSVIIMAFTSLVGVAVKTATGTWQPGVLGNWLAAAPVVALGAPLGVFVVGLIGRKPTLLVVAVLCIGQYLWTGFTERETLGVWGMAIFAAAVLVCLLGFEWLRRLGNTDAGRDRVQSGPDLSATAIRESVA
ncbi:sulfite exporter TauE/SafE family protein [Microbulbifer elongatus]|uniref:Probable membrane transporter protein n=1 Tax=Microbulbifer elongatus TaxID=86173 RepID=A0ABT1NWM0_9GAMM|nr:sulfite exporter TauE/SafE family protein [Microbulbifer elongatus]MCQ3828275.1 sulfite exporter TauE/SafE family protein [Microbulbifer elongatus]